MVRFAAHKSDHYERVVQSLPPNRALGYLAQAGKILQNCNKGLVRSHRRRGL